MTKNQKLLKQAKRLYCYLKKRDWQGYSADYVHRLQLKAKDRYIRRYRKDGKNWYPGSRINC